MLFHIRKVAIQLARAELGVSVFEWESLPILELFRWYNDVKIVVNEAEQGGTNGSK